MPEIIKSKAPIAIGIFLTWVAIGIIVFVTVPNPPIPPEWLRSWTVLLAQVITLSVGLTALWNIPTALRELARQLAVSPKPAGGTGAGTGGDTGRVA